MTAVGIETLRATAAEALLAPLDSPAFTGTTTGITADMVGAVSIIQSPVHIGAPIPTGQSALAVAIGDNTGANQGLGAVSVGYGAGGVSQGAGALALGLYAGGGGTAAPDSISIGHQANWNIGPSVGGAIAIGAYAAFNQTVADSIVIDASGTLSDNIYANTPGFFVRPVRSTPGATPIIMAYDTTNNECVASGVSVDQVTGAAPLFNPEFTGTVTMDSGSIHTDGSGRLFANTGLVGGTGTPGSNLGLDVLGLPTNLDSGLIGTDGLGSMTLPHTIYSAGMNITVPNGQEYISSTNGGSMTIDAQYSILLLCDGGFGTGIELRAYAASQSIYLNSGTIQTNLSEYADNAAATGAGKSIGSLYYTNVAGDGIVKVVI